MIDRRQFASGEGRESRFSFSCMHWDHEPTPNPSQEGNFRAADECLLPSWEGSGVGRFMESAAGYVPNPDRRHGSGCSTSFTGPWQHIQGPCESVLIAQTSQ